MNLFTSFMVIYNDGSSGIGNDIITVESIETEQLTRTQLEEVKSKCLVNSQKIDNTIKDIVLISFQEIEWKEHCRECGKEGYCEEHMA